jgi:hypothetical protein
MTARKTPTPLDRLNWLTRLGDQNSEAFLELQTFLSSPVAQALSEANARADKAEEQLTLECGHVRTLKELQEDDEALLAELRAQLAERDARIMEAVGIMEWMRDEVDFKDNTEAQRALAPVYAFLTREEQRKKETK